MPKGDNHRALDKQVAKMTSKKSKAAAAAAAAAAGAPPAPGGRPRFPRGDLDAGGPTVEQLVSAVQAGQQQRNQKGSDTDSDMTEAPGADADTSAREQAACVANKLLEEVYRRGSP